MMFSMLFPFLAEQAGVLGLPLVVICEHLAAVLAEASVLGDSARAKLIADLIDVWTLALRIAALDPAMSADPLLPQSRSPRAQFLPGTLLKVSVLESCG